eukprot:4526251-Prymnesium_polylepis.1
MARGGRVVVSVATWGGCVPWRAGSWRAGLRGVLAARGPLRSWVKPSSKPRRVSASRLGSVGRTAKKKRSSADATTE